MAIKKTLTLSDFTKFWKVESVKHSENDPIWRWVEALLSDPMTHVVQRWGNVPTLASDTVLFKFTGNLIVPNGQDYINGKATHYGYTEGDQDHITMKTVYSLLLDECGYKKGFTQMGAISWRNLRDFHNSGSKSIVSFAQDVVATWKPLNNYLIDTIQESIGDLGKKIKKFQLHPDSVEHCKQNCKHYGIAFSDDNEAVYMALAHWINGNTFVKFTVPVASVDWSPFIAESLINDSGDSGYDAVNEVLRDLEVYISNYQENEGVKVKKVNVTEFVIHSDFTLHFQQAKKHYSIADNSSTYNNLVYHIVRDGLPPYKETTPTPVPAIDYTELLEEIDRSIDVLNEKKCDHSTVVAAIQTTNGHMSNLIRSVGRIGNLLIKNNEYQKAIAEALGVQSEILDKIKNNSKRFEYKKLYINDKLKNHEALLEICGGFYRRFVGTYLVNTNNKSIVVENMDRREAVELEPGVYEISMDKYRIYMEREQCSFIYMNGIVTGKITKV